MLLGSNFVMHKKMASLWRYLRTPVLLTSATVFAIGCASKNPLIDEADPIETSKPVPAREETKPAWKEEETTQTLSGTKMPDRNAAEATQQEISESENELNTKPTGMKKWLNMLAPYKVNIQQGNFISSEMLAKIRPGMTKEQVRFVLGTPLLTDMFHAGRWDYIFRLQKPNGATTTYRVTVFFSGNLVDHIINDRLPSEAEYLSHITSDDESPEKAVKEKDKDNTESTAQDTRKAQVPEQSSVPENAYEPPAESGSVTTTGPASEATSDTPSDPVTTSGPDHAAATNLSPESANPPESAGQKATPHVPETGNTGYARPVRIPKPVKAHAPASVPETVQPSGQEIRQTSPVPARDSRLSSRPVAPPAPVRAPEPASTPEPVSAPVPEMTRDPSANTEQANRLRQSARREALARTMQVDTDDSENVSSGNISTFEPISTPSRIGKMLPASPNDELIGNIQ